MQRRITGFFKDERGDWAARLDCGHPQHTRHAPPFVNRPWVESAEGQAGHLGEPLDCVRCDRLELPDGLTSYRCTPEFDADSVPGGLTREHRTKAGVWGRLHVLEGRLRYVVLNGPMREFDLRGGDVAVIAPEMPHYVTPLGPVRFYVEFLRLKSQPEA